MLFVPYSAITSTTDWRTPVRSDATTMTTTTPMTMPKTVRKLRSLCARMLSSDIRRISDDMNLGTLNLITLTNPPPLLPRERDDGVEARSLEGRVDAGDDADAARDGERHEDVDDGDRHRHRRRRRDEPHDAEGQQQPEHAAEGRQERGLDEELQEHLLARRAERLAQADLEGALRHGDEHDVHDDDAADHQGDERDGRDDHRDAARDGVDLVAQLARVDEAEVVLLAPLQLVLVPQGHPRVLDGGLELLARRRLAVYLEALAAAEDFPVGGKRDVRLVVERVAEHRAALLLDADDRHRDAADAQRAADGVYAGEELLLDVVADDDDHRGRLDLLRQEEAPLGDGLLLDGGHVGGAAGELRPVNLLALVREVNPVLELRADLGAGDAAVAHPLVVFEFEPLVAPVALLPLLLRDVPVRDHAADHEVVRAEDRRHLVHDVRVEPR